MGFRFLDLSKPSLHIECALHNLLSLVGSIICDKYPRHENDGNDFTGLKSRWGLAWHGVGSLDFGIECLA